MASKDKELDWLRTFEDDRRRGPNPNRRVSLKWTKARRDSGQGPLKLADKEGSWGYVALQIPELDMAVLHVRYPELISKDAETRNRAWQKFLLSPESAPYRTDGSIGKRKPYTGIIVK